MEVIKPPAKERFIALEWRGPYLWRKGKLVSHPVHPDQVHEDGPGLYLVVADSHDGGPSSLRYIGKATKSIFDRLKKHASWLETEWRPEIYAARVHTKKDLALLSDAEELLIYAHSPPYNSTSIAETPKLAGPLRIWNVGRAWRLDAELSSSHPFLGSG